MKFSLLAVVGVLLFSGCVIGGNSTGTAHDLATLRAAAVPEGLLVPPAPAAREKYRNDVLAFRTKVGGGDTVLGAYLSGSAALVDAQDETDAAVDAIKGLDPTLVSCETHSQGGNALLHLQKAVQFGQNAQKAFQTVQGNADIANALGAEYVVSVGKTLSAMLAAHAERIHQIKIACGQVSV